MKQKSMMTRKISRDLRKPQLFQADILIATGCGNAALQKFVQKNRVDLNVVESLGGRGPRLYSILDAITIKALGDLRRLGLTPEAAALAARKIKERAASPAYGEALLSNDFTGFDDGHDMVAMFQFGPELVSFVQPMAGAEEIPVEPEWISLEGLSKSVARSSGTAFVMIKFLSLLREVAHRLASLRNEE